MSITPVTLYRTSDGVRHETRKAAEAYEGLAAKVAAVMAPLGSWASNDVPAVSAGKGWVQHSEAAYRSAHRGLCKLTAPIVRHHKELAAALIATPDDVHPMGIIGRVMEGDGPIEDAWSRLRFIDSTFREHQQPYYAINGPREGQVCVEDRRT